MTRTDTVFDSLDTYRGHFVTVRVEAEPPLPHDEGDDESELRAKIRLYDTHPSVGNRPEPLLEREHPVTVSNLRESISVMVGAVKDRVDDRVEQVDIVETAAAIAVEDELGGGDDD